MVKDIDRVFFGLTRRRFCLYIGFLFILVAGGCAAGRGASRADYLRELRRWTRDRQVFSGFDNTLNIKATYKSPLFKEAYIDYYSKSYALDASKKRVLVKRETENAELYNEFFLAAETHELGWNDFDRNNSVWKLYLEDSAGNRLSPISIAKIDRSDPLYKELFPYTGLWGSTYLVRFPKYSESGTEPVPGKETQYIRLVVTGVLGTGDLEWRLDEGRK